MFTIAQRLATATQLHQSGKLQEAEAHYRAILKDAPTQPHALHLLGLVAHQTGRHQEAFELISQAITAAGSQPIFLSNLAAVCLALDRLDEAVRHGSAAIRLQPNFADAHSNLGVALRRLGRLDEAETAFHTALRLNPKHIDARSGLGAVLHRQGRIQEAITLLQETVKLAPAHAQSRNDLGGVLLASDRAEEAETQLREAIRLRPAFHEAHANLGMALHHLGRPEEATLQLREAIRLKPDYARAHDHLGYVLESMGKLDEAVAEFEESLRLEPNDSLALAGLTKLAAAGKHQLPDGLIERMRSLAVNPSVFLDDRCRLHFSLAGWFDRSGDYDLAFQFCQGANELRQQLDSRAAAPYDLTKQRQLIDRLIAFFTPDYFKRVATVGVDSELPIFVVGMLRSGSTLTEQILASHPATHATGEVPDIPRLIGTLQQRLGGGEYPDFLNRLDEPTAKLVAEAHLDRLRRRGGSAVRVVDKLLFNYLNLGVIATLFPRARIIHCVRDPIDTCLSCYFQNFAPNYPFKLQLRDLGLYYREYQRLMTHWKATLPMPVFELHYEELTENQEVVSRQLIDFCGLEWDERCLRFNDADRPVRTASILQVRQPMYRSSVGRWKRYETHLRPLIEALMNG